MLAALTMVSRGALAAPVAPMQVPPAQTTREVATGAQEPTPVVVAAGAREPQQVRQVPERYAVPVDPPAPPAPKPMMIGVLGWSPLLGAVESVHSRGKSRTGAALALLSYVGRGWWVPGVGAEGEMGRVGGQLSAVEGISWASGDVMPWPLEIDAAYGRRWTLGGNHHVHALAGVGVLERMATHHKVAFLHVPDVQVGYQWHGAETFVEIGPRGGIAAVGHHSFTTFGDEVSPSVKTAGTYAFRPYAGALATVVLPQAMMAVEAQRTYLSGGSGRVDDRVTSTVCSTTGKGSHSNHFGGCIHGAFTHARVGSGPEFWSYQVNFTIGVVSIDGV